ncbi:putative macrophage mannose receptor 1-like [Apostichopus japonicus]|uniref:Putative macrophage mannose receptor 1-like n=1 Tax=Stichopus japonicus TaxID=307972 RepID=A0A2G8JR56_STIJA|nr:putative macrophage mannose receptor 1-like [Apostichopus japonicus]
MNPVMNLNPVMIPVMNLNPVMNPGMNAAMNPVMNLNPGMNPVMNPGINPVMKPGIASEDTCLFEGWRCSDQEHCVNTQTSFECRCNNRTTGKNGTQCEDKSGTPKTETTTDVYHNETSNGISKDITTLYTVTTTVGSHDDTTNGLINTSTGESLPEGVPSITGCVKLITYDESVYCFISANLSWEDTEEMCSSFSFHLVDINNSFENDFLRIQLLSLDIAQVWVGYRYNYGQGKFQWSMKSNEYTNWAPDEPDESSKQRCVYMTNDGYMHDVGCNETISQYPYVCEFEA